jgi:predicted signal transduction protein with EAL and GGDEF domain
MNDERPLFQHPPWMVGIMLILGVMSLLIGLTIDPFWLVMGSPAILTLVVFIGVRVALSIRLRRQSMGPGQGAGEPREDAHPEWVRQDEQGPPEPGSTHDPDR